MHLFTFTAIDIQFIDLILLCRLEEACSSLHQSIILHNRDSEHKQAGAQVENSEAFPNLQGEVSSEDDEDQGQLIQHTGEVNRPKLTGDKDGKQAVNVVGDSNIVTLQQLKKVLSSFAFLTSFCYFNVVVVGRYCVRCPDVTI